MWWERIGATKASGITKLMFSEAQNFPEIAQFYQQEVILPGRALIRRILQRGMERGEFRQMDLEYGTYIALAPMMFLMLWNNSIGPLRAARRNFSPEQYIRSQIDNILHGLCVRPCRWCNTPTLSKPMKRWITWTALCSGCCADGLGRVAHAGRTASGKTGAG